MITSVNLSTQCFLFLFLCISILYKATVINQYLHYEYSYFFRPKNMILFYTKTTKSGSPMFRTRATTLLGIIFSLHRILPFFLINFLTNPLHRHPIQLLLLSQPDVISLHIFHLMKCPLPSAYPACIIAVILCEFALFFSFYYLSTILAYKTIFIIKSLRGGVILHALLLAGGGSLYVISIFLIHDIRIYEPQSGMSLTTFAGM